MGESYNSKFAKYHAWRTSSKKAEREEAEEWYAEQNLKTRLRYWSRREEISERAKELRTKEKRLRQAQKRTDKYWSDEEYRKETRLKARVYYWLTRKKKGLPTRPLAEELKPILISIKRKQNMLAERRKVYDRMLRERDMRTQ